MQLVDPVARLQFPLIRKIIADETWLVGERRHQPVSPDDPEVRENVCRVILRIGAKMREKLAADAVASGTAPRGPAGFTP